MAERRRRKKKETDESQKLTKEETAIAKHLRFNLPTKPTSIEGHKVEYFTGSKAVTFLQDSNWATGKRKTEIIFTDRDSIVKYLNGLLWKGLFYRALKVVKKSKKDVKEKEGKEKEEGGGKKEKKSKKEKKAEAEQTGKSEKDEGKGEGKAGTEAKDGGKEETPKPKKKEGKKKIKLEPTEEQKFVDGNDAFVWVYDPIRPMNYVYGLCLVIAAIAVCLFPLWPPWMRVGTYYLSLCGAGFVGAILALAVLRLIFFVLTWGTTFGKVHFWLFPNLLADVGIKESFMPFYEYEVVTNQEGTSTEEKQKNDSNGGDDGDQSPQKDQPGEETFQGSESASGGAEKGPENIGALGEESSDRGAEVADDDDEGTPEVTNEENSQSTDMNDMEEEEEGEENEEDEDVGDDDEEEEEEDENGDDFEMIDEDEISEVMEGSGGSQHEEEE